MVTISDGATLERGLGIDAGKRGLLAATGVAVGVCTERIAPLLV